MADTSVQTHLLWHTLESTDALTAVASDRAGLSSDEAVRRRQRFGANALPAAPPTPWWTMLGRQMLSPLIAILAVGGVITALQRHWVDAGAVTLVIAVAVIMGYWHERKAERDVRALQTLSTTTARVMRDHAVVTLASEEIVPGDIVLLESGERVPADIRLFESNNLRVDESMLTGESLPVRKSTAATSEKAPLGDWEGMALSGTLITHGRGSGVVVATGADTQLGEINRLASAAPPRTPLQILTQRLERRIGIVILLCVSVVFTLGLMGGTGVGEMVRVAVALAVAAIPESFPVILTVAMSVGVSRMAKHGAIVRTLPAVETLGSTTVIASDKTGTLTQNRLTVERLWTMNADTTLAHSPDPLVRAMLRAGALTNEAIRDDAGELVGDAVDVAMASVALATGAVTDAERTAPPVRHVPYEPELRYSVTIRERADGGRTMFVKGAPDAVAQMCDRIATAEGPVPIDLGLIQRVTDCMAAEGLRVLATASRDLDADDDALVERVPHGLVFLGMEGMADPPRDGVAAAVDACRRAGIRVKMVTGDHPRTADAIARRLGLESEAPPLTGGTLHGMDDETLAARLDGTAVVARVSPADKLRIVRVLQERGDVVAVTGDGVNDAPALRAASIGVAMGKSGTDVARESADVILVDDNFSTIVAAVTHGRVTFAAIRKATFFLLSTAVAGLLSIALVMVLGQPLLFLPVQVLWINLVTSGIQDIALALEPSEGDELDRAPRHRSEGVLSRTLWLRTMITGVWMGVVVALVFIWSLDRGASLEEARTFALTTFVLFNFFQVGNARSEHRSVFLLSPFRNKVLWWTSIGAIVLLWAVMTWPPSATVLSLHPLSLDEWILAALIAGSVLVLVEIEKVVRSLVSRRDARSSV